ncbi:uncharacterized protein LOC115663253 isoform X2 [Syzygium oleosum]|uniref:uncharacterized protein LOC115663253 isoform X2 n=1 Tax=Syzygium oleosum TaxID=219896 RepID=UPI0024B8ED07|nr:uncharacterized protein LOC115663253 isoform X2 [Syzygium oleosum]
MDYSLAALKLLSFQLKEAIEATSSCSSSSSSSPYAFTLGGLLFQRAWLQGVLVLVRDEERLLIDDGTGVVQLSLPGEFRLRPWKAGMYVMVVGAYCMHAGEVPMIKSILRSYEEFD